MTTYVEHRDGRNGEEMYVVQSGPNDYDRTGRIVGWTFSDANIDLVSDSGARDNFEEILGGTRWCWATRDEARTQAEGECRSLYYSAEGDDPMPKPEWVADENDLELRWELNDNGIGRTYIVYPIILYVQEG